MYAQDLTFILRARIYGADSGRFGDDDLLYVFPQLIDLPSEGPRRNEFAIFDRLLGRFVLNEDDDLVGGLDELYAFFASTNTETGQRVHAYSPETWQSFD